MIIFGLLGFIIDKIISNGTSLLCKISHYISCSDIDKPTAKLMIVKGMSYDRLEKVLGFPLQIVKKDATEIYIYKFIKITIENGKVADFE